MCRFVAYLGEKPALLNELLDHPSHSLIKQSRQAIEGKPGINADGFGIGWYDHDINDQPGLFKSIQPAWNDQNLKHMAAKLRSHCFIAHIRAATIGDVNFINCHPFAYQQFLFAHNGTICGFNNIKRSLLNLLDEEHLLAIKGQTDSEYFFTLIMNNLYQQSNFNFKLDDIANAMQLSIQQINSLQQKQAIQCSSKINCVLTDGKQLVASRYISPSTEKAHSLYYAVGNSIDPDHTATRLIRDQSAHSGAVIVASEPLTDYADEWHEVPSNHIVTVDEHLKISLKTIG